MEERQTKSYLPHLDDLISLYNNQYHRIIKTSPFLAEKAENYQSVLSALEQYYNKAVPGTKRLPKFKLGDHVRITAQKSLFHKGYYQTFRPNLYKISKVLSHLEVPMYKLSDVESNVEEAGTWYEAELQLVSKDYDQTLFKIEEIIKTKGKGPKKQALVKWKYWPASANSWVPFDSIKDL